MDDLTREQIEVWKSWIVKHSGLDQQRVEQLVVICDMALRACDALVERDQHRQAAHEADMRTQAAVRSEKAALAQVEALKSAQADAERGRWMLRNCAWHRGHESGDYIAVFVPHGTNLDSVATREIAIDAAMQAGRKP